MPENTPEYSIADDYDPDGDRPSADSDPVAAYLTYLEDKRLGAVGEMGPEVPANSSKPDPHHFI
jgi:hypothetical protein